MSESADTVSQCINCGNRIWSDKDPRYASVPVQAVPTRLVGTRNGLTQRGIHRVCGLCAIELELKEHFHSDPAQMARETVDPGFSWA